MARKQSHHQRDFPLWHAMDISLYVPPCICSSVCVETWTNQFSGGGISLTTNRTYWPTTGGAIAFQPGWFRGHQTAFAYVNIGFGTEGPDGGPANMTQNIVPQFQILGPTNNPYPGTICLPQVPLPANTTVKAGDHATIQVVMLAMHGAALFSVRLLTAPHKPLT